MLADSTIALNIPQGGELRACFGESSLVDSYTVSGHESAS